MAAVPFVPLIAAGLGTGASIISGNKAAGAARDAANQQEQLSRDQMAMAQAEKDRWWGQLSPAIADYKASIPSQLISPELTARMYDFFNTQTNLQAGVDRTRLAQDLARRGLDTSGIYGRALSDFAAKQADVKTGYGLQLAKDAATTNYNAQNAAKQYMLSLLMSGYGGGQGAVNQSAQIGAGLGADAIAARLAGSNAQTDAWAKALGSIMGGVQGMNWSQWSNNQAAPSNWMDNPQLAQYAHSVLPQ